MKLQFAIITVLCIGSTVTELCGQQLMSKEGILATWKGFQKTPNIDSIFRFQIHEQTRKTFDWLQNNGIDTILVYTVSYPGSVEINTDSCSTLYPVDTYFFWRHASKTYKKTVNGTCETEQSQVDNGLIKFISSNYGKIADEFFMNVIYEVRTEGSDLQIKGSLIDHEPNYEMLIQLNGRSKYLRFTESELTDKKSIFHYYNRDLTSYKLFKLVINQVK